MNLPPDRSHLLTEQTADDAPLHRFSVSELVAHIQDHDAQITQAMAAAQAALSAFITAAEPGFIRGGRLIYFGAGTSGRLGVLDASEAPPTFHVQHDRIIGIIAGGDGSLRRSSEGKEDEVDGAIPALELLQLGPDDCLLGIAAGGTTPYVRGGLSWAGALPKPPQTGLLTCCDVSAPDGVGHCIRLLVGPEVLTGSTRMKAGTATKLALNTISTALMIRSGRVYNTQMVALRASNEKLRDRAARIIARIVPCNRELAFSYLEQAAGDVRLAIICARRQCDLERAKDLFAAAQQRFADVIES